MSQQDPPFDQTLRGKVYLRLLDLMLKKKLVPTGLKSSKGNVIVIYLSEKNISGIKVTFSSKEHSEEFEIVTINPKLPQFFKKILVWCHVSLITEKPQSLFQIKETRELISS